jgi:hypothetical protein
MNGKRGKRLSFEIGQRLVELHARRGSAADAVGKAASTSPKVAA